MSEQNQAKLIAAIVTFLLMIGVILLLFWLVLRYDGERPVKWPPEDTSELLLDGEYVKYGDISQPVNESEPAPSAENSDAQEGEDLTDSGEPAEEAPVLVSSEKESPMKETKKPEPVKTGPTAAEIAEQERIKKEQEAAKKINNRVKGSSWNNTSTSTGSSGSPNGNSSTGALSGTVGIGYNLGNRKPIKEVKPQIREKIGIIVISIRVNRVGEVTEARYLSSQSSGAAAGEKTIRESCEEAAKKCKFSADPDAPASQIGTITFYIND